MKKDAIITISHGYQYPTLKPFLKSALKYVPNAEIIIFCSEKISYLTKLILINKGIKLIFFDSKNPLKDRGITYLNNISINNYRFLLYYDYLIKNRSKFNSIIITDVRDVIFQSNPFCRIKSNIFYFFFEDPSMTFNNSKLNYGWAVEANGIEFTNKILNKTVSCAGVSIGSINEMIAYLEIFDINIKKRQNLVWGYDQGLHNGILYGNLLNNYTISTNDNDIVFTMGASKYYQLNEFNKFVNNNESEYSIIHQYDRNGKLLTKIKLQYSGSRLYQILSNLLFKILP